MRKLKIVLVAPMSTTRHRDEITPFRFDYAYWNIYLPLLFLGHEVYLCDTSVMGGTELKSMVNVFKPDLVFCVMTGNHIVCPHEPWNEIRDITSSKSSFTFNWFCDDSWRFDSFSNKVCWAFNACSTPEKSFVEKYKAIGYQNIVYATWMANHRVYTPVTGITHPYMFGFVGAKRSDRAEAIQAIEQHTRRTVMSSLGTSFEDMLWAYQSSRIGLNFTKNSMLEGTQMKARIFEIAATGNLVLTQGTPDLINCFDSNEIVTFSTKEELCSVADTLLNNPQYVSKVAKAGYHRFLRDHTSEVRLTKLLEELGF